MAKIIATVFGLAVVGLGSFAAYQFITTPDNSEPSACCLKQAVTEEAKPSCCQSVNRAALITEVPACCSVNEPVSNISEPEVLIVAPREVK